MADEAGSLPLRRLEVPIHKFIKVAIPTDLERLRKHQINIEKYQRCQQWDRLHQEHINASRTVQQLRANIREMEKLCARVRSEDTRALDRLVRPTREQASVAASDFLRLHSETAAPTGVQPTGPESPPAPSLSRSLTALGSFSGGEESSIPLQTQTQLPLPEIPRDQNAAESWETLEEDLLELNGLVNEFAELVHSQQEKIDSIEDHVNTAAANVQEGSRSLGQAARYKMAMLPVAGAVIGGVVGGPLGLLAGFKVAGVAAAVSGGLLGYAGGNLLQKSRRAKVDTQLQQLSTSCPELCKQEDKKKQ
ncbi:syntaxin-17 isoform X1 [Lepisosteus oculatus]|uniref:syntaxin-17 isoform X1 n=1 Tax=Lepisosteus oculatus TaxID=7918 RepID=UPI0035F5222D